MQFDSILLAIILIAGVFLSISTRKLTVAGAFTGALVGFLIFKGGGFAALAMVAVVFVFGTIATSHKLKLKQQMRLAEINKGRRKASQVAANAGAAAMFGALAWIKPHWGDVLRVMMSACLASAVADTLSSELGNVYGKRFYNIISWKKDQRGLNGVISAEGTLIGLAGSTIIAAIYLMQSGFVSHALIVILAGTAGNLADSVLGATLERKKYVNNDTVNFLNTLIAAFVALLLILL